MAVTTPAQRSDGRVDGHRRFASQVRPTGRERTFGVDEVIVSKTDVHGVITYANDVFLRIASMSEREAIGAPHSIIRHPDMPRAVFKLLWDTIERGDEIFAYVVNLAKNGDHYWVFAHITPTFAADGSIIGYHSNRRVPERSAITALTPLYAKLKAIEDSAADRAAGLSASTAALNATLADLGIGYDEFVFSLSH
jgi:PAS domain S-box-containing protein